MKRILVIIRQAIRYRFNLHEDKDEDKKIVDSISRNIDFKGSNLWALIFAILIASIGLNVNSTAVIIGAMLISPLMGPILGVGLGIGISDFTLIKRGLNNLAIATFISIVTSSIYFYFTPLHNVNSELLARTNPSIWDVFIAFSGGLAGTVATSRKEKSTVIPGVAIATALMPPLCTAGYGLATGNLYYMAGALYLFFINSVFICTATYLIVTLLKIPTVAFETERRKHHVRRYMLWIVVITLLPSIYLAYNIVKKSIFETNAQQFVNQEINFHNTQILNRSFIYNRADTNEISILLLGDEIPDSTINKIEQKLPIYNLSKTKLVIRQGLNAKQQIDFSQIKASILEDVFTQQAKDISEKDRATIDSAANIANLRQEIKVLFPVISNYSISNSTFFNVDSARSDTITLFVATTAKPVYRGEYLKMHEWLRNRLRADSLMVITTSR